MAAGTRCSLREHFALFTIHCELDMQLLGFSRGELLLSETGDRPGTVREPTGKANPPVETATRQRLVKTVTVRKPILACSDS
jgi:hypothetical protein